MGCSNVFEGYGFYLEYAGCIDVCITVNSIWSYMAGHEIDQINIA